MCELKHKKILQIWNWQLKREAQVQKFKYKFHLHGGCLISETYIPIVDTIASDTVMRKQKLCVKNIYSFRLSRLCLHYV